MLEDSEHHQIVLQFFKHRTLDQIERFAILTALKACNGSRTDAARELGLSVRTVERKIRLYKLAGLTVQEPHGRGRPKTRH